jgi:hypothetical protein
MDEVGTMDLMTLDSFSRHFGKQLFSVYPEWASLAKPERMKDAGFDHLIVEVPSPPGSDLASTLLIHTENQDLDFIASILSEKLAAVSEWRDNIWRGSWTCEKEEEDEDNRIVTSPGPLSQIRIRSWNGSRDRDMKGPDVACFGNPG